MEWDGMKEESKGRNQIQQGDNNLKENKVKSINSLSQLGMIR
jgi:hypothetical protein